MNFLSVEIGGSLIAILCSGLPRIGPIVRVVESEKP